MRKSLLLLTLVLWALNAKAVIAYPYPQQVVQPDGSTLTIQMHGDEWLNFATTLDGYTVVQDNRGYYTFAEKANGNLVATNHVARDNRSAADAEYLANVPMLLMPDNAVDNGGEKLNRPNKANMKKLSGLLDISKFRGLVVLCEYNDRKFTMADPKAFYTKMVNDRHVTSFTDGKGRVTECTGSVRDYFYDNSNGQFDPPFDVVGPVLINKSQTYVGQTSNARTMFRDVLTSISDSIDFSKYDTNGDNVVDMVFFIVAGGGSNFDGSRKLWPHASTLPDMNINGMTFGRYACTVELNGLERDSILDGVGTTCHEFSHVLGLPDMYDVNYSTNGQSVHPASWDVMASGSYLNTSRTPAGYNSFERYAVGWLKPQVVAENKTYTLKPMQTANEACRINSTVEGLKEYFLVENRQQSKWDAYLPGHGMLVWRVDSTDASVWQGNKVNAVSTHNYFELIRACQKDSANLAVDWEGDPFPGANDVTSLGNTSTKPSLMTFAGEQSSATLDNIAEKDGVVSFKSTMLPIKHLIEDFEELEPTEASTDTVTVKGSTLGTWKLLKSQISEVPDSTVGNGKRLIAIKRGGEAILADAVQHELKSVRFNFYNPTQRSAVLRFRYKTPSDITWRTAKTYSGETMLQSEANSNQTVEFRIDTTDPVMFEFWLFTGSSTELYYIDDVVLTYMGENTPDPGAVDEVYRAAEKELTVVRTGNDLTVKAVAVGSKVSVYDTTGRVVATAVAEGNGQATLNVARKGFYIVTANGKSAKVIL